MELWIRSQDKRILQKVDNVYLNANYENKRICTDDSRDYESELGEYKSEQRALEVLDEIQKRLINIQIYMKDEEVLKHNNPLYPYMECVYEMPKE